MNPIKATVYYLIAFFIQPILINLFGIESSAANLVLCVGLVMCLFYGDRDNAYIFVIAFIFALLQDVMYSYYLGVNAAAIIISMLLVFVIKYFFNLENPISILILSAEGTIVYNLVIWIIYHFGGSPYSFLVYLKHLPYNYIFMVIAVGACYFIMKKFRKKLKTDFLR
ncbi:MAG: hypothetical protein MJ145_01705 [Clostridia bacterium]|nr:hypothetical protein [Clostridia bacterium]